VLFSLNLKDIKFKLTENLQTMNCRKIAEDTFKLHREKLGAIPEVLPVFTKDCK